VPLLPLFTTFGATAEPKMIKILIYGYHTLLGVNSYVYDDDKSIKRSFNFIEPFGVPLFATFWATAETKIIEIQIYGYHTMMIGVYPYVFDDDRSIKRGFNCVKLFGVPLLPLFFHFLNHRGAQN
jgi:hypothetical protein